MYYLVGYQNHYKPDAIVSDEYNEVKMYSHGGDITSRSRGYNTLDELLKGEGVLNKPCVTCQGVIGTKYYNNESMIARNMCFSCNFWEERLLEYGKPNTFVINGIWYTDGGRRPADTKQFLGFGGQEYLIERSDGTVISTNNLWYGGAISKWYTDKFPDNAKFL